MARPERKHWSSGKNWGTPRHVPVDLNRETTGARGRVLGISNLLDGEKGEMVTWKSAPTRTHPSPVLQASYNGYKYPLRIVARGFADIPKHGNTLFNKSDPAKRRLSLGTYS